MKGHLRRNLLAPSREHSHIGFFVCPACMLHTVFTAGETGDGAGRYYALHQPPGGEIRRNARPLPSTGSHGGFSHCPGCGQHIVLHCHMTKEQDGSGFFFQIVPHLGFTPGEVEEIIAARDSREPIPGMPTDAPRGGKRFKDDPVPTWDEPQQRSLF